MSWAKVKNIMIIILVAINLFLIVDIAVTRYASAALPRGTGESFERVLNKNGIEIEKSQVPAYYETRKKLSATFYDIDYLTKIFLNSQVNYISDGINVIARADNKRLSVSGVSFEFTNGDEWTEAKGSDIIKAMEEIGLSTFGARYVAEEDLVRVFCDGMEIEGIYLDVKLNEAGEIAYLKGVWPKLSQQGTDEKVSVISVINNICTTVPQGSTIRSIEAVFVMENKGKSCVVTPGWKIHTEKAVYIIN